MHQGRHQATRLRVLLLLFQRCPHRMGEIGTTSCGGNKMVAVDSYPAVHDPLTTHAWQNARQGQGVSSSNEGGSENSSRSWRVPSLPRRVGLRLGIVADGKFCWTIDVSMVVGARAPRSHHIRLTTSACHLIVTQHGGYPVRLEWMLEKRWAQFVVRSPIMLL